MILQALVNYYEELLRTGKVEADGWCRAKVSFALDLNADGQLRGIIPLKEEIERGRKKIWAPVSRKVPQMVARSSGVSANFLCDNSKYMLGIDANGSGGRIQECFLAAKDKHEEVLRDVRSKAAEAVKGFFRTWKPDEAAAYPKVKELWDEITAGGNLIFHIDGKDAQDDEEIADAWRRYMENQDGGTMGVCLVTGERAPIARTHTDIKGVVGAQSSGAALVSFNAQSFESYGKKQSYNAPVGEYAVLAYTTALNYLLSRRDYVTQLGDTTVVYWAEGGEEDYQKAFSWSMEPEIDNQEIVRDIFEKLKNGGKVELEGLRLDTGKRFFVLGLAPNAARLAVRFFYQDSFGNILKHMEAHYHRLEIEKPSMENRTYLGVGRLLQETVNQNAKEKKPLPGMAAAVMRSVLSGSRYPESLYGNLLIRVRAEQGKITWRRAAIVKAYLIQNYHLQEGENFVSMNDKTTDTAYILGAVFAVLESIQEEANPALNATIRDRYFNSACASPASVFPILLKLKNNHIGKLKTEGKRIYYENMLMELMGKIDEFPVRLNLEKQGYFMLGYYHQVQKRFTKKEDK